MMKTQEKDPVTIAKIMKISRKVARKANDRESLIDRQAVGKEVANANHKKYHAKKFEISEIDKLQTPITYRYDSGELMVITRAKQLSSYIMTITNKSPKRFRFNFVNYLNNQCISCLDSLYKANVIKNKLERSSYQLSAYSSLRLIGYFSLLACENQCILKKQFAHISMLVSDAINLLFAWRKSDDKELSNV